MTITVDSDWTREDLAELATSELDGLLDETDRLRISLQTQIRRAKANFKAKGRKSDPEWMARTEAKLAHIRTKRRIIEEVRAEQKRLVHRAAPISILPPKPPIPHEPLHESGAGNK